jgi:chitosanase
VAGGFNLTDRQKATIEAIVCVVESGRTDKYNAIATIQGDTGGLSYGRHQASLNSGNLFKLVSGYCKAPGAALGEELSGYLQRLETKNQALNDDPQIKSLLRRAGLDPVMTDVQDEFFYNAFMVPALERWQSYGFVTALSAAVIYDSYIHGSFDLIAKRATASAGEPTAENEKKWIKAYLDQRLNWLKTHSNKILNNTAIRIEALLELYEAKNWDLHLPFNLKRPSTFYPMTAYDLPGRLFAENGKVKVARCTAKEFGIAQARSKSKAAPGNQRDMFVQRCLIQMGYLADGSADGDFGAGTEAAIKQFQKKAGLSQSGVIGESDFAKFCEAAESGIDLNHPSSAKQDAGLKPVPDGKDKAGRIGGAGAATVGAGAAGAGAVAMGAGASDDEGAATTATDATATATAGAVTPADPATTGAPVSTTGQTTDPITGQPVGTPATTGTAAPVPVPVPLPQAKDPGKFCARTEVMFEPFGCKLSKVDVFTTGAVGAFVIAVALIVLGRRMFDTSNK